MEPKRAPNPFYIDRRIPIALMFTVFLQLGAVVWWASMVQAQNQFRDARLNELETKRSMDIDREEHILERLSRLEARSDAQLQILEHLDAQLGRRK